MPDKLTSPIDIREAHEPDLVSILSLYRQLDEDEEDNFLTLEQAQALFKKIERYPNYKFYVAEIGQEIVGTFSLLIMDNLAHEGAPSGVVEAVVVGNNWRNKGIGKAMMLFALEQCRSVGCYKMALSSNLARPDAHRFYEALDFNKHGYSFSMDL